MYNVCISLPVIINMINVLKCFALRSVCASAGQKTVHYSEERRNRHSFFYHLSPQEHLGLAGGTLSYEQGLGGDLVVGAGGAGALAGLDEGG